MSLFTYERDKTVIYLINYQHITRILDRQEGGIKGGISIEFWGGKNEKLFDIQKTFCNE